MEADVGVEGRVEGDLEERFDGGGPVLCSLGLGHIWPDFLQSDQSSSRNLDSPTPLLHLLAAVQIEQQLLLSPVSVPEIFLG